MNATKPNRGGCLVRLFVLSIVLGAALALGWMMFLPAIVTTQIRARTGFDVKVASLACNAFTGRLTVRGLVLSNPGSFPMGDFVELREFALEADVGSLVSERLVLDELRLDVRKVTLVRRADGRSNAEVFQQNLFGASQATPAATGEPTAGAPPRPVAPAGPERKFLIRRLTLRFEQLVLADHSEAKPAVQEYKLGLDQRYENVTDTRQLLVPEVLRRLAAENLGPALSRLVPGDFGRALGDKARDAGARGSEILKDAGAQASELLKGLREKLEESRKP